MDIYLYNQSDSHDKVYFVQVKPDTSPGKYEVVSSWGARSDNLLKTKQQGSALTKDAATKLAQSLAKKKISSGYIQALSKEEIPVKSPQAKRQSDKRYKVNADGEVSHIYLLHANEMPLVVEKSMVCPDMGVFASDSNKFGKTDNVDLYNTDGSFYLVSSTQQDMRSCVEDVVKRFSHVVTAPDFDGYIEDYYMSEVFLIWAIPNTDKYFVVISSGPAEFMNGLNYTDDFWSQFKATTIINSVEGAHLWLPTDFNSQEEKRDFFDRYSLKLGKAADEEFWNCLSSCSKQTREILIQKNQLDKNIPQSTNEKSQHKI